MGTTPTRLVASAARKLKKFEQEKIFWHFRDGGETAHGISKSGQYFAISTARDGQVIIERLNPREWRKHPLSAEINKAKARHK